MGLSYISLVIKSLSKIFVKRAKDMQKNALKHVPIPKVSSFFSGTTTTQLFQVRKARCFFAMYSFIPFPTEYSCPSYMALLW